MTDVLPRWDPTDLFPDLSSRELASAREALDAGVTRLVALYDTHGVGAVEPHPPSPEEVAAFDEVVTATNDTTAQLEQLRAYVFSFVSTDSRNGAAQVLLSELDRHEAALRQLSARFTAWVTALGPDRLTAASPTAADHEYAVRLAAARAEHQMSEAEESLYAELRVTGSDAWYRLHADVSSQLTATVVHPDGRREVLPITAVRALASHPDRATRQAAYRAELEAWPMVAVPLAAAMNAIKGEMNVVNARRGWSDPLDASLFANRVDRATFDAMWDAVGDALPDFRRYFRAKARLLGDGDGDGGLCWWDLFAPVGDAGAVSWEAGTQVVQEAFGSYAPELANLVARARRERWIDAEPRAGKRGGAFCMRFFGDRSLVLVNWADSFDSVQMLAHELGHAYHNTHLADRTPLQRQTPMALAETASIFCETLVAEASLAAATSPSERLAMLDIALQGPAQVIVDIRSRFQLEAEVFARRARRTLTVDELNELMLDAQADTYGDGLDLDTRHPWMWAVKPHYYGTHFYNWPYTYGLLFGLGLYARYQDDPTAFRNGYSTLLASTGMAGAAELAERFGIDVRDPGFWRESLDVLRARIDAFAALATTGQPV